VLLLPDWSGAGRSAATTQKDTTAAAELLPTHQIRYILRATVDRAVPWRYL